MIGQQLLYKNIEKPFFLKSDCSDYSETFIAQTLIRDLDHPAKRLSLRLLHPVYS